jgi:hypothetical protein
MEEAKGQSNELPESDIWDLSDKKNIGGRDE